MKSATFLLVLLLSQVAVPSRAENTVVPVPAIPGVAASTLYQVRVNGIEVPVNDESRYDFQTAAFCLSGTATVEVRIPEGAKAPVVRPLRYKIVPTVKDRTVTFSIDKPLKLVMDIPGQLPLALLATPLETRVPQPNDPHVLYFGPGVHEAGIIHPESNQTIYLAPGALVKGRIEANGVENVTVKGRGVLDGSAFSERKAKTPGILFSRCSNIKVEGIGYRAGSWWQSLYLLTNHVEVSHMNLFGNVVNTDGIDLDGVQDLTARDCFIRCADDGFGWHAVDGKTNGEPVTKNCLAEDCVIWNTSYGNGLRVGASMETQLFQDITFRNIDVLRHANAAICSDHSDWAWCKNIRFENFTDETPGKTIQMIIAKTRYSNDNGFRDERGHFEGLHFVHVTSPGGAIELRGFDAGHLINDVTFEGCVIGNHPIKSLGDITVNEFVTNISFPAGT